MNLTWFGFVFVALTVIGVISSIIKIDQPRKPITHLEAAVGVVMNGFLLWGLIAIGMTNNG